MKKSKRTHISEVDAKGGRRVKGMPYVLGLSTLAIILLSAVVYASFAA